MERHKRWAGPAAVLAGPPAQGDLPAGKKMKEAGPDMGHKLKKAKRGAK